MLRGRARTELPRDSARRARSRGARRQGGDPRRGALPRIHALGRRSGRYREARRHPRQLRASRDPARQPSLELPRPRGGHRDGAQAQRSGLFQRRRKGAAATGRSASLSPHPRRRLQAGRRHRDRGHALRFPHGLRQAPARRRHRGTDRPRLSHRRQEPRRGARPRRPPGGHHEGGHRCGERPRGQSRQGPRAVARGAPRARGREDREADAAVQVQQQSDPPLSGRLGAQRVSHRRHDLHRRRRRRGHHQRASRAAPCTGQLDGSGRPRLARRRHGIRHGGEARAPEEGGALLLRRRLLRHDGFRHGDRQPFRCALPSGHRQQLCHEPDPLRTDREVRRRAR